MQARQKKLKSKYVPTTEFYSQVIDSLHDYSIFTLDMDFNINSWSSGSEKIFGYTTEEVIGESFDLIFTEEDLKNDVPRQEIENAISKGRATDNRWHITKDKSLFYAYGLVFPLLSVKGEMIGYVKILQDLTKMKKSEDAIKNYIQELEELNTHKESVLAILSHDLRSPLSSIIGIAEYLKENFQEMDPKSVQEMLNLLYESSTDELEMLDYLVEWARIKYASEAYAPKKLNIAEYIDKVLIFLDESANINNVDFRHDIEKDLMVYADSKMLMSIIRNIVSNAIKYTEKGGSISISAKTYDDKILFEVKDTGVGMSQKTIEKLFTPQMKILSESRKINKGAGIGLLLVKGFIEKHGGEIWVKSILGEGTSFFFTMPIDKHTFKIEHLNGKMVSNR